MRAFHLFLLILLAGFTAGAAQAQSVGLATDYVRWKTMAAPEIAEPGDVVRVLLDADIEPGWKMYALDSPRPSRGLTLDFQQVPPGFERPAAFEQVGNKRDYDPFFKTTVSYFENKVEAWGDFLVTEAARNGTHEIGGVLTFQICNDKLCLPPTKVDFGTSLVVRNASTTRPAAPATVDEPVVPAQEPMPPADEPTSGEAESEEAESDERDETAAPAFGGGDLLALPEADAGAPLSREAGGGARGLWGFLLLAVGAGLAALLTPCVFPMIPLTVSYFTRHSEDRRTAFRMALVYGGAIVLTFTGLGVLMALLVGAAGAQRFAANPWVNLFIGLVFVVFALSLLGLFELRVPSRLVNFFNRKSNESRGYVGVWFMGFTLTLVSFSCTAPFVGGLLAATAAGAWSYPVVGMVVFSATFSLPFMFFALFPKALSSLPRSGAWMNIVKVVLGFIELVAALKFLSNADLVWGWGLLSRTLAIALTTVIFFLAGLYLLGKLPLKHQVLPEQVGVGRLMVAIGFFGLSLYLIPGLLGAPLNKLDAYLPPRQADDVSLLTPLRTALGNGTAAQAEEAWLVDDIDAAFERARAESKPVLIDFTGYTCTNCREMEANVFTRPAVAERFARDYVLLRLYTDGLEKGEDFQRYQLRLTGTVALPTYAVVSPFSQEEPLVQISGTMSVERFAAFLDEGTTTFLQENLALGR